MMATTHRIGGASLAIVLATAQLAGAQVREGDQAPMFQAVDQHMRNIDMADFIDGTPLLFLYTSAT
jgi:hypothetical protein